MQYRLSRTQISAYSVEIKLITDLVRHRHPSVGYNQKGQLVQSDIWVINKMGPLIQILTNPDLEEAVTQASS